MGNRGDEALTFVNGPCKVLLIDLASFVQTIQWCDSGDRSKDLVYFKCWGDEASHSYIVSY